MSRGWKRDELRTDSGQTIIGIGMDKAIRGVKVDDIRPDLIIFDDLDGVSDTEMMTRKKTALMTQSIMPSGSPFCAYVYVQNLTCDNGIMARLRRGEVDFMSYRTLTFEPAMLGLKTEIILRKDGPPVNKITAGRPTWAGQDRATCQHYIDTHGLKSFLIECQHEVDRMEGAYYPTDFLAALRAELSERRNDPNLQEPLAIWPNEDQPSLLGIAEVFEAPLRGARYVVSADEAGGLTQDGRADFTVVHVLNHETGVQALAWHCKEPAMYVAGVIAGLATWYNNAEVIVEQFGSGTALIERLQDHPVSIFKGRRGKAANNQTHNKLGFVATRESKADRDECLLSDLDVAAKLWREGGYSACEAMKLTHGVQIRCLRTVNELIRYCNLPGGKRGGVASHDDENTALTQAVWYRQNVVFEKRAYRKRSDIWSEIDPGWDDELERREREDEFVGNAYGGPRR